MTEEQVKEIKGFVRANETINAIKHYRRHTGLGLKESKEAIDHYIDTGVLPVPKQSDPLKDLVGAFIDMQEAQALMFSQLLAMMKEKHNDQ